MSNTDKYKVIMNQVENTLNRWNILCQTPVVDDDFPEMRERFELELGRLKRLMETII